MPFARNLTAYSDKLGQGGSSFERELTIDIAISDFDGSYGTGSQNKVTYTITSSLGNITLPYELDGASNITFANGTVTGNVTLTNGNATLDFDANVWENYANANTAFSLSLRSPSDANTIIATSSNVLLRPVTPFTALSANSTTVNRHVLHMFDSYNSNGSANVWDDLQVTNTGESDDTLNTVTAIVVGGGGAGGKVGGSTPGGGGGGGQVVFYQTRGTNYSVANVSITLGAGGVANAQPVSNSSIPVKWDGPGGHYYYGNNVMNFTTFTGPSMKGGNTVFGFHETASNITAQGGGTPIAHMGINNGSKWYGWYNANVGMVSGGSGALVGSLSNVSGWQQYVSQGGKAGRFGIANAGQAGGSLSTVGSIETVGANSTIYVRHAGGGSAGNATWTFNPGLPGYELTGGTSGAGGPNGGTLVSANANVGADWDGTYDGRGIMCPYPSDPTNPTTTYFYVSGGGSAGNSHPTMNNLGGTTDGNTSIDIYPAGSSGFRPNPYTPSTIYTADGLRGGGGQGALSGAQGSHGDSIGGNGGDGCIIVYYPSPERMRFSLE